VPATGMKDPSGKPILWESCVTINNESWGYNKYETVFKTERDLIRMLVEVVSKGGNLLLNIGPRPDGRIQDEFVSRLNAIGRWMKVNSEAIYGTTASPFSRLPFFGRATAKDSTVYLHVFDWPADGRLRVPGLKNKVLSARLLANPAAKLAVAPDGPDVLVSLPAEAPDEVASVVALALDGPPEVAPFVIRPAANGAITLGVESCEIASNFGQRAKKENALGHVFLTNWTRAQDIPTWTLAVPRAGRYRVEIAYGNITKGVELTIAAGAAQLKHAAATTSNGWVFKTFPAGEMELAAGEQTLEVKTDARGAVNLEKVILTPVM
jgi:alpha-L-fucosidase